MENRRRSDMDASRLQALPISRLQFNVQTKCRDAGESLTNANAARIVVTNSVEVSRQTSAEAAMRRTGAAETSRCKL